MGRGTAMPMRGRMAMRRSLSGASARRATSTARSASRRAA
jgi:hypothetical protein